MNQQQTQQAQSIAETIIERDREGVRTTGHGLADGVDNKNDLVKRDMAHALIELEQHVLRIGLSQSDRYANADKLQKDQAYVEAVTWDKLDPAVKTRVSEIVRDDFVARRKAHLAENVGDEEAQEFDDLYQAQVSAEVRQDSIDSELTITSMTKQLIPKTINAAGIEEIRAFLVANHKTPELYEGTTKVTMDMLRAWAADAEFSLSEGNDAGIELKSWDSIHGRTQTFTVSDAGVDSVEFDDEE